MVSLLSYCMIRWPIYRFKMGLERRTGNVINWMQVKALGQSVLVVKWDMVNKLLLDCNWTPVSLSHTLRCTDWKHCSHVTCCLFFFHSNKSWWICTLLLGRMQQCRRFFCQIHFKHFYCCVHVFHSPYLCFPLCSHLCLSTESMFVHSNGGQGWPSKPHPLWPDSIWDNHCCSCCQDSQNTASRGHRGGKAILSQPVRYVSRYYPNSPAPDWSSNLFMGRLCTCAL